MTEYGYKRILYPAIKAGREILNYIMGTALYKRWAHIKLKFYPLNKPSVGCNVYGVGG